jgi:prepilin-type N-terminal cleavage/methylation domain-containing protein
MNIRCASKKQRGFSMIEVLVSFGIFGIAALGVAKSFGTNLTQNSLSEKRTGAVEAVQQILEQIRVQNVSTLPSGGTETITNVTLGPRVYEVRTKYCAAPNDVYCISSNVRFIEAKAILNGRTMYETSTVYAELR